jgi:hypothetical protein
MQPHKTTSNIDDLVNEIQFEIPEAVFDAVELFVRRAIVTFCEKTNFWCEDLGPVTVNLQTDEYDLPISRTVDVVEIVNVLANRGDGSKVELERCASGDVKYRYWQPTPTTFTVSPIQELAGSELSVICSLKPQLYGNQFKFSEQLLVDHRDALVAGAKSMLYKIPRKPWSDLQQAQINANDFQTRIAAARRTVARGYSISPDRVPRKQRPFY